MPRKTKTKRTPRAKHLTLQEQMLRHMEDAINLQARNATVMETNFAKFAEATDRNTPWRVSQRQMKAREHFLDTLTKAFRHHMELVKVEFLETPRGTSVEASQTLRQDAMRAADVAVNYALDVTFHTPVL